MLFQAIVKVDERRIEAVNTHLLCSRECLRLCDSQTHHGVLLPDIQVLGYVVELTVHVPENLTINNDIT